mgnify:CR=1 FL=1
MCAGLLFLAGVSWVYFLAAFVGVIVVLPHVWERLHDYQRERVLTFIDPERDPLGSGYHISQSKIAIGSGGLFGLGLGWNLSFVAATAALADCSQPWERGKSEGNRKANHHHLLTD